MGKTSWSSVSLPNSLMGELDRFLESEDSKNIGVSSRSQIISLIIRKFLEKGIDVLSNSDNNQNTSIIKLEKKLADVEKKLEKHEDLIFKRMLRQVFVSEVPNKTTALHGKDGMTLIKKVDPPSTPNEIIVYYTTDRKKALKDNHVSGLIIVKINRKKLICSYHPKDNSCSHIIFALESDEGFVHNAYMKDVKNPVLDKVLNKI